jgi:hypothetical protein
LSDYIYTSELSHHGTKGMKWGIRRYRNKDGSLTPYTAAALSGGAATMYISDHVPANKKKKSQS